MKKLIVLSAVMLLGSASYGVSAHHCTDGDCTAATIKGNQNKGASGRADWVYLNTGTTTPLWTSGLPTPGVDGDCDLSDGSPGGAKDGIYMTKPHPKFPGVKPDVVACKDLVDDDT